METSQNVGDRAKLESFLATILIWTTSDEYKSLYNRGVDGYTPHLHSSQQKLTCTWWQKCLSLLLRSVKRPVFSNMSANPCRAGVVRAYLPMAAISNTSWDALMSYFLFITCCVTKRFETHSVLGALLSLCLVRVAFPLMNSYVITAPHDVFYLPSKFVHSIQRHPV
ncbi:hypothetical protein TNCV_2534411 [Trichonephila clavipes]|nr:hypothetical protein TNCV_2534411 [Trichonephila clavipes]